MDDLSEPVATEPNGLADMPSAVPSARRARVGGLRMLIADVEDLLQKVTLDSEVVQVRERLRKTC
jgi:hypothetical protein